MQTLRQNLNSIVTQYDAKELEKNKKNPKYYYNHYALGIYLIRVADVCDEIEKGADIETTIKNNFNDRLLTFILKKLNFNK